MSEHIEFAKRIAKAHDAEMKVQRDTFYSQIFELLNNLQDDLELDLNKGEDGYKTYEESYRAVRKHTLRLLRKREKKMRMNKMKDALVSGEEQ